MKVINLLRNEINTLWNVYDVLDLDEGNQSLEKWAWLIHPGKLNTFWNVYDPVSSGLLWLCMEAGVHRLVIIGCYTLLNGDNWKNQGWVVGNTIQYSELMQCRIWFWFWLSDMQYIKCIEQFRNSRMNKNGDYLLRKNMFISSI